MSNRDLLAVMGCKPSDFTTEAAYWAAMREARLAVIDLVKATNELRNYVDISTIRTGKAIESGWISRVIAVDEVLKRMGGVK